MNAISETRESAATSEELMAALQEGLSDTGTIVRLERRASSYRSSFPLEELILFLDDGDRIDLIFKNVNPNSLSPVARRAKPEFLDDPRREPEVYRTILCQPELGTPHFYGSVIDVPRDRFWLFLERVPGRELYQIGDLETWCEAARWLAYFHHRFATPEALPLETLQRLVHFNEPYCQQWFERAAEFAIDADGVRSRSAQRLARHASALVRELLELPVALIHGEFYASNVLVDDRTQQTRVCPLDWERTAIGPGLIDLAALVAGQWSHEAKCQMVAAYHAELLRAASTAPQITELLRGLDLCRLHLAVQWLGWSASWTPPREHCQDWLAEALQLAQRLGYSV